MTKLRLLIGLAAATTALAVPGSASADGPCPDPVGDPWCELKLEENLEYVESRAETVYAMVVAPFCVDPVRPYICG